MTETFTASNGVEVVLNREHWAVPRNGMREPFEISTTAHSALREFFLHERDKELGRWRSKKNPNWTAAVDLGAVHFRHDDGIHSFSVDLRRRDYSRWALELREVAKEYFAAHPDPKPWHDAKDREVWALTVDGKESAFTLYGDLFRTGFYHDVEQTDTHITAGRRIWPEEA